MLQQNSSAARGGRRRALATIIALPTLPFFQPVMLFDALSVAPAAMCSSVWLPLKETEKARNVPPASVTLPPVFEHLSMAF